MSRLRARGYGLLISAPLWIVLAVIGVVRSMVWLIVLSALLVVFCVWAGPRSIRMGRDYESHN